MSSTIPSFLSSMGGPLFMLRWTGTICPCMEKSEDSSARVAFLQLSGLHVTWYRSPGRFDASKSIVSGIVSGWFGSSSTSSSSSNTPKNNSNDAVDAVLEWVDHAEKGPELQIKPLPQQQPNNDDGGISLQKQASGYIKTIPLKQLDKVILQDNNYLVLQTEKEAGKFQDLVTLGIRVDGTTTTTANTTIPPAVDIKDIKEAFQQMVEWDGRRRAAIPEEDRELDEEQGIAAKAKKMKHFAKREIEMQQQRRDREKRKAVLVQESGGLKYTALAMANRADG